MVRESLFNIIGDRLVEASFLDLFAGCGSVGLEALSRGAESVVFVDQGRLAHNLLQQNITSLKITRGIEVVKSDALKYLESCEARGRRFDYIFVDPPYATELFAQSLEIIARGNLLTGRGIVIGQHARRSDPDIVGTLHKTDERKYGKTRVTFWRPHTEDD